MTSGAIEWEFVISVLVTLVLAFQTAIWRRLDKMDKRIDDKMDRIDSEKQITNVEKIWCTRVERDLNALHQRIREMREESVNSRNEIREYIKAMHEGLVDNLEQLWTAHRSHSHGSSTHMSRVSLIDGGSN